MRPLVKFVLILSLFATTSCGMFVQDSVTFHGTQCSDSRFWYITDALATGAFLYLAQENDAPSESYLPAAGLAASGLAGWYKRKNCLEHQGRATPEQWARDAERSRQSDEAQRRALGHLREQMAQRNQRQPRDASRQSTSHAVTRQSSTSSGSGPTIRIERHMPEDEMGKTCTSPNNTDKSFPTAGTCKYGALCSSGRCTMRCKSNDDCPSARFCGWSDGATKTQICR